MRLSELVSKLTPATFTIVALLIFFAVFLAVTYRTLRPGARADQQRAVGLPLDEARPVTRRGGAS